MNTGVQLMAQYKRIEHMLWDESSMLWSYGDADAVYFAAQKLKQALDDIDDYLMAMAVVTADGPVFPEASE